MMVSPAQTLQLIGILFGMLAAAAWMKRSAYYRPSRQPIGWTDRQLNKLVTDPTSWTSIAAGLWAVTLVCQAVAFLPALST